MLRYLCLQAKNTMQGVKNVMRVQPLPKGKLFTDYELMIVVLDIFSGYLLDILMKFFFWVALFSLSFYERYKTMALILCFM